MSIDEDFFSKYTPLVTHFCAQFRVPLSEHLGNTPQPFFPSFGTRYADAPLRVAFVGMETRGWGNAKEFIEKAHIDARAVLRADLEYFRGLDFCDWTNNFGYTFFDFVLFFLSRIHKLPDFKVLKRRLNKNILQSFAWGNCNAIERYEVTSKKKGVPYDVWKAVKDASVPIDQAKFIIEAFSPDVLIILWKRMSPAAYFEGMDYVHVSSEGDVDHFTLKAGKVHVFRIPHPQNMRWGRGREYFADRLAAQFAQHGFSVEFPTVLQASVNSERFIRSLVHAIPAGTSKFECVEWLANRLGEKENLMTIPALTCILNELGYRTNYGSNYVGGRGTYRLVKSVYDRCCSRGDNATARRIAEAFVRPNGEYAYA